MPDAGRGQTLLTLGVGLVLGALLTAGLLLGLGFRPGPTSTTDRAGTEDVAPGTPSGSDEVAATTTAHQECAPSPSACGYPDAGTTGPPPGTELQRVPEEVRAGPGWRVHPDGWIEVTQDGATLERIRTALPVVVAADDVTVRHVVVEATGEAAGVGLRGAHGTLLEASRIGPPDGGRLKYGVQDIDGDATGTRVVGNDISRVATGIAVHAGVVQGNFVHDLVAEGDDHVNGIVSYGSTEPLEIRSNTVLNPLDQTDAVALFQSFGVEANRVVADNLLAGGSYSLYAGGPAEGGPVSWNIQVVGNRFARTYFPEGGVFGPATSFDRDGRDNIWADNIWDDTGRPVPAP